MPEPSSTSASSMGPQRWSERLSEARQLELAAWLLTLARSYRHRVPALRSEDAEDAAQDVFEKYQRGKFDQCADEQHLEGHLRAAVHHRLIDLSRIRQRRPGDVGGGGPLGARVQDLPSAGDHPSQDLRRVERRLTTDRAIERVRALYSDHQWLAFYLKEYVHGGRKIKQAADEANQTFPAARPLTEPTLWRLCQEIKQRIRMELEEGGVGPEDGTSLGADIVRGIEQQLEAHPSSSEENEHGRRRSPNRPPDTSSDG